ncbi:MAG: ABC transporter ATP-binding protein [Faecalicatena sp.]|uniref:ABC transporter ATP-binding protein n=1 Tax=Faecalicatena sp. TaxID=2005360 RepID=UPI00258E44BF|nr:ABC transporter ATP-binding protein [Faecalicatena sp.]MCI6465592.1 ABC transporter ATP-binding protein [Faecalicatena sp.]MDY5617424.1 ABC transporter ATP-binding protein [Lachnospiraceae bacterium]
MKELLHIDDVEKYYGSKNNLTKAINRISFTINQGEFTGIMGASGSGKTTLLNLMATVDTVTSGHIWYGQEDITRMTEDQMSDFRKNNLGFVFQDYNLLDTLTIKENISLAMALTKKSRSEIEKRTHDIMERLEIWPLRDQFPYQVSGGQKQRCACARALINHPKIIFADEPTGALDSKSARMLLNTFTYMNQEMEATILMVTHDAFSASYCSRILFLKDGQIFHELYKGDKTRKQFLDEILDVLSLTGGDGYVE